MYQLQLMIENQDFSSIQIRLNYFEANYVFRSCIPSTTNKVEGSVYSWKRDIVFAKLF